MPDPRLKLIPTALRYVGVAMLFAVCGAWTGSLARWWGPETGGSIVGDLQIPFSLLCALLFLRTKKALLVVPLIVAVWVVAWSNATHMGLGLMRTAPFIPMCVSGFIGGLGVALAASICHRSLRSLPFLAGAAVTGCVSALPFGPWLALLTVQLQETALETPLRTLRLQCAFAVWQAAVGTYLYAVCTDVKEKPQPEDPQEGHPV